LKTSCIIRINFFVITVLGISLNFMCEICFIPLESEVFLFVHKKLHDLMFLKPDVQLKLQLQKHVLFKINCAF